MQFKVIISRAMFIFNGIIDGKVQLHSVRFLSDSMMQQQNNILMIRENDKVDFFFDGSFPLSKVTNEQFIYLAAASRFFGHLPGSKGKIPMWFSSGSLEMGPFFQEQSESAALVCS